ncbi:unnamed protein product [Acanthoscelides obtectus]|uniref:Uncharacterized protein n=1 Tax=Acanthoscelides obtectus TaxID=200917 RepID=A0A9P0M539_ACAOB|nr:unnamed protein product [Acanthoscelides obtectus]CAK1685715.1 hypothetical protein AOBTE_LOCUS35567 [Acanthoscelides obtectus]
MDAENLISVLHLNENPEYILFKIALLFAEQSLQVWFISPKPFENIPVNIVQIDKEILQQITFLYLKDFKDLITELNGIHLWHKAPNIIILSHFKTYLEALDKNSSFFAAFILASVLDGAAVSTKRNKKKTLVLICLEDITNLDQFQIIFDMYFSHFIPKMDQDNIVDTIVKLYINQ